MTEGYSDVTATLALLRSQSLTSVVYRAIESMILQGELVPGQRVNENALATQLSVSRGPIREALRALEQAGLVKLVARRGVFVQEVSLKEALNAYDVRASLLGTAGLALARTITEDQLESLHDLVRQMGEARADGDIEKYYPLNLEFHNRLIEYSHNEELYRTYHALVKKLHLFRRKALVTEGGMEASTREHKEILKSLAERDPERARRAMEGHVLAGKERFLKANEVLDGMEQRAAANED